MGKTGLAAGTAAKAASAPRLYPKWQAIAEVILALALLVAGFWVYVAHLPPKVDPVPLQWSASLPKALAEFRQSSSGLRTSLDWDMRALIPGYLFALLVTCRLSCRVFWRPRAKAWAWPAAALTVLAAACNWAQDGMLLAALSGGLRPGPLLNWAEALSLAKFTALLVAGPLGLVAIAVTLGRLVTSGRVEKRWTKAEADCQEKASKESAGQESKEGKPQPGRRPLAMLVVIAITLGRLVMSRSVKNRWEEAKTACQAKAVKKRKAGEPQPGRRPLVIPPPEIEDAVNRGDRELDEASWWKDLSARPHVRWAQGFASPSDRAGGVGVCVSGGGIRSAAVALGALNALRDKGVLKDARHLVSVSGGGYTAGGLQLAMTNPEKPLPGVENTTASPADAFASGSPEEDHLRRHSSYIADGLGQWLVALGVLLRGVFSSLVVIGLTVTALGLAIGRFYYSVPIIGGGCLPLPRFAVTGKAPPPRFGVICKAQTSSMAPSYPAIPSGVSYAIAVAAGFAVVAYLARQLTSSRRWARRADRAALAGLGFAGLMAVVGLALPALLWASSWITWPLGFGPLRAAAVSSLSLVATYVGTVVAVFWRNRTTITKAAGTVTGFVGKAKAQANQVLPNSMTQLILMWICLAFVILVAFVFGGWVATSGLVNSPWALAPVGALVILAVTLDQTSFSLHPFYRRHLARAFAVRRVNGLAVPFGEDEMTWLDTYGKPPEGFPAVTFAATANVTGQDRTPPGRPAVPFMLAHDYVGGPATGWVRTDFLRALLKPNVRNDLTVEAAMAISGAAFASAMGSQTRFYEVFLAISNARLGAWLPNPYFVALKRKNSRDWTIPDLPGRRRLSYFAREVFGLHPSDGRMLLCTDGGHYDNLGLVELFRRRCQTIYCIDASGASQPLADALAGAITLGREELGVDVSFAADQVYELVPGGWGQLDPADSFKDLNARLAKSQVAVGRITYPEVARRDGGSYPETTGQIVFAQAVLAPDVPYQLLDFPQADAGFPHDSTGDQFFDVGQFDAYQTLGYFIGHKAHCIRYAPDGKAVPPAS